jgi:ribosomal protein S18 acetylase RimI-like enzyme
MIIRKAERSDAPGIARLYMQFWKAHRGCDPLLALKRKPALAHETRQAKKDMRKRGTYVFVAEEKGRVKGFMELLIKRNDPVFSIRNYGYLNSCVVDARCRKRGIARQLTRHALGFLKGKRIGYVKTNVYLSNKGAAAVWRRLGFREISEMMIRKI